MNGFILSSKMRQTFLNNSYMWGCGIRVHVCVRETNGQLWMKSLSTTNPDQYKDGWPFRKFKYVNNLWPYASL